MGEAALQLRTEDVTAFGEHCEFTGVMSDDREKWLELRRELLTASDVAAVLGHYKQRSALAVYVDKVVPRTTPEVLTLDDPRFWGNVMEQPMLRAVADYYGWKYRQGGALLRSRKYPWLGSTLDAEIDRNDGRGWIDFEGKTSRITKEWSEQDQDLPIHILIQVQAQLLVSKAPVGLVFALLVGSRPCKIEIEPNDELHALIVEESEAFMDRVRRLDPPPPDGTESSTNALHKLYPVDDGSVVRLLPDAVDWTRELAVIAEQKKRLEKRETEIKNLLRSSIGKATFGVLDEPVDGRQFWRWQAGKSGGRTLLHMKNGPYVQDVRALPPCSPLPDLEEQLRESVEQATHVVPIERKRRRARR